MSHYIETTEVTDSVVKDFIVRADTRVEQWLTCVDNEVKRLALKQGLFESEILTPLNSIVKEYAVAYFCLIVFRDNIGSNNVDVPAEEKYRVKYDLYVSETDRLKPQCTKELLRNNENIVEAVDMASVTYLARS
jgi:hypothetical protein